MNDMIQIKKLFKATLITICGGILATYLDLHFNKHGVAIYFLIGYTTMGLSLVTLFYDDYVNTLHKLDNILSESIQRSKEISLKKDNTVSALYQLGEKDTYVNIMKLIEEDRKNLDELIKSNKIKIEKWEWE